MKVLITFLIWSYLYSFAANSDTRNKSFQYRLPDSLGQHKQVKRQLSSRRTSDAVDSIADLEAYSGSLTAITVRDLLRGGLFTYKLKAATVDNGIVFNATGKGSGYWVRQHNGIVQPEWWGAKGDNVTDDRAAIQAAFDAFPDRVSIAFRNKTYRIDSTISKRDISNINIQGNGAILHSKVDSMIRTFQLGGSERELVNITSNIIANTNYFKVNIAQASKFHKGDWARIKTRENYFLTPGRDYKKGELVKVEKVVENSIFIEGRFDLDYSTIGNNLQVLLLDMVENVSLENITVVGDSSSNKQIGLYVYNTIGLKLNRVNLGRFYVSCEIDGSANGIVTNGYVFENDDENIGYGIVLTNSSRDFVISNNTSYKNRHFFTTGGINGVVMNVLITGNVAANEIRAPYHTHGNAKYITFSNNHVMNSVGGVASLSSNTVIAGNKIVNGSGVTPPISTTEAGGVNLIVRDNTIKYNNNFISAIEVLQTATALSTRNDYVIIENNRIDSFPNGVGIFIENKPRLAVVRNNSVRNFGYQAILIDSVDNAIVTNNAIERGNRNEYSIKIGGSLKPHHFNSYGTTAVVSDNDILEGNYGIQVLNFWFLTYKNNIMNVAVNKFTVSNVTHLDTFGVYQSLTSSSNPTFNSIHTTGGAVMTSGWNRSILMEAAEPMLAFKSTSGKKYAGIGNDGTGFYLYNNAASEDIPGTGTLAASLTNTGNLAIAGQTLTLQTSKTPSSANDRGTKGMFCWDANFLYVCVATNQWKRITLGSW